MGPAGRIIDRLVQDVEALRFGVPVTHVYNPLVYARAAHDAYVRRYGRGRREVLLLGMNPGPWGMAQTGVPFGDVGLVRYHRVRLVVGLGRFAEERARAALTVASPQVEVGRILHPSPASPLANRGWGEQATRQLSELGVRVP